MLKVKWGVCGFYFSTNTYLPGHFSSFLTSFRNVDCIVYNFIMQIYWFAAIGQNKQQNHRYALPVLTAKQCFYDMCGLQVCKWRCRSGNKIFCLKWVIGLLKMTQKVEESISQARAGKCKWLREGFLSFGGNGASHHVKVIVSRCSVAHDMGEIFLWNLGGGICKQISLSFVQLFVSGMY